MSFKKYTLPALFLLLLYFPSFGQTGNVKQGTGTGVNITTGDYNTIVGDSTAFRLTSASLGVFLGRRAGHNTTSAFENVFIGADAGYSNTTGTDNVFIGFEAGYSIFNRSDNVFIGTKSGRNTTSGDDNTFIGEESGLNNTTGDENVFIGEDAGYNNTTGYDNTFIGRTAGRTNTTGYQNTAIGHEAGYDITEGYYNTFVGDSTGVDVGTGKYNTFIGQAAGAATEHANGNTFVGFRAGWDNNRTNSTNNANENTYFGFRTGHTNREGSYNVMLGSRTDFTSTRDNLYNIGLGYDVSIGDGFNSKNYAIAIGAFASVSANRAIAIGYQAEATLPNTMVLGGSTNRVTVGIGTDTPNRKASLDLADTDKGFLINRLTNAQKTTLEGTLEATDIGLLLYDTDDKILYTWNGTGWDSSTVGDLESRVTALENKANGNTSDKTPLLFNYQTALLNASNQPLSTTNVSFRISILQTTSSGTSVYQETHSVTTNASGIASFKIGNGTIVSGVFSDIDWGTDLYFLKIEADVTGGTTYVDFGTSQFVTVPYAMHARTADRLTEGVTVSSKTATTTKSSKSTTVTIESLQQEVATLKALVVQLQNSLKN